VGPLTLVAEWFTRMACGRDCAIIRLRDVPLQPATFPDSHFRPPRSRLLIFIVACHAETAIKDVFTRVRHALADEYDIEVLITDDGSREQGMKAIVR
jgi:hypothetical protein